MLPRVGISTAPAATTDMGNRYIPPKVRTPAAPLAGASTSAGTQPLPSARPQRRAPPPPTLHPRNRHQGRYDLARLIRAHPGLKRFVKPNPQGIDSIDFADPAAVEALNAALLTDWYSINGWSVPTGFLCPPIPGRADYLHHAADVLAASNGKKLPRGPQVRVLDIGTGANVVYPLIGHSEYAWSFVGSEISPEALASAQRILAANPAAAARISLRRQTDATRAFAGIVTAQEEFDLTVCNPPFHATVAEAKAGSQRKWRNLSKEESDDGNDDDEEADDEPVRNFGGQTAELTCPGGELGFISRMITESAAIGARCAWFTALVAQGRHLDKLNRVLHNAEARTSRVIDMGQGQTRSRLLAWTFLDAAALRTWAQRRWH